MSIEAGNKIPEFNLPATGGRGVSAAQLKGRKFVLYFYPKADTPGCTTEACAFEEALPQLGGLGAVVIGVSKDAMPALEKFARKYNLSFPLASDAGGDLCERLGVWVEKSMYGKTYWGIERSTFLIDEAGVVTHVWRKVKVDGHAQAVRQALAAPQ